MGDARFIADGYAINMTITDAASGRSGTISLAGQFDGWFNGSDGSHLTQTFTSPAEQSVTLGGTRYTLGDARYVGPQPVNDPNWPGRLTGGEVDVTVTAAPVGPPEPATAALAGVGLVIGVMAGRLRRLVPAWE